MVGLAVEIKPFSWRIGVDGRPNGRNKASWRISVDGRPNGRNKARFRDGLVWTVGLTVEIKLRFRDGLVWTVGPTVEINLRFRDGLVWTVRRPNGRNKASFSWRISVDGT